MKSAITYLTHSSDVKKLNKSIESVRKFMDDRDIVVFYEKEDDIVPNLIKHDNIRFEELEFSIPKHIHPQAVPALYYQATLGYRHMCRWWAGTCFMHPVIQEYDYILRLDSDSFILDRPEVDPIKHCADNKIYYGYLTKMEDVEYYTRGLKDSVLRYCAARGVHSFDISLYNNNYYYTNFEIVNVEKVWNASYEDLFEYLDVSGGIYFFRWGDHVIRYLATKLSLPDRYVQKIKVPYQHQEYICQL